MTKSVCILQCPPLREVNTETLEKNEDVMRKIGEFSPQSFYL